MVARLIVAAYVGITIIGSLELLRRRLARGRTEDLDSLLALGLTVTRDVSVLREYFATH